MICESPHTRSKYIYRGACRVPFCRRQSMVMGICKVCYQGVYKVDPFGVKEVVELRRLGIMLPDSRYRRVKDSGISLEVVNYQGWLPKPAAEGFGGLLATDPIDRRNSIELIVEWEAEMKKQAAINWNICPKDVAKSLKKQSRKKLRELAANPTRWSPGTAEKVFTFHLREVFGLLLLNPYDSREPGNGTPLERTTNWDATPVAVEDEEFFDD